MGAVVRVPEDDSNEFTHGSIQWHVELGSLVEKGETIAEVKFERETITIVALEQGTLHDTFVETGQNVVPGRPIGVIVESPGKFPGLPWGVASEVEASRTVGDTDGGTPNEEITRFAHAVNDEQTSGTVQMGGAVLEYDSEKTGSTPTPIDLFLGALSACLSLAIRYQAQIRNVGLNSVTVDASAFPDTDSVEEITIDISLDVDGVDDDTVDRIVSYGEQSCHVEELLRDDIPIDRTWRRTTE